jgi:molybdate transport system substrate-binding protein
MRQFVLIAMLLSCGCETRTSPAPSTVRIAAAADLKFALDELIREFAKSHPEIPVHATYGSSGLFYTQLTNNAPFDVFLSADMEYPRQLVAQGLALPDSEFLYAIGRIVVWVPNQSVLDLKQLGLQALVDPSVKRVAIANPRHAPYGRAAEAALRATGVYEAVHDRLVLGDNVAQTAQFVESGAADVGMIALSLALAPAMRDRGRFWEVPLELYPQLDQGGVIMSACQNPSAARTITDFLRSSTGRAIFRRYGFALPGE